MCCTNSRTIRTTIAAVTFVEVIETVGKAIDASGVAVIVGGALLAVALTVTRRRKPQGTSYELFRRQLGRSILLGLEFLVAADIIRTVAVTPTGESVLVLAGIVLIRTFLSFSLQLEMTGAWPWQKRPSVSAEEPGAAR
jgi:uncharacterized membrane protein